MGQKIEPGALVEVRFTAKYLGRVGPWSAGQGRHRVDASDGVVIIPPDAAVVVLEPDDTK